MVPLVIHCLVPDRCTRAGSSPARMRRRMLRGSEPVVGSVDAVHAIFSPASSASNSAGNCAAAPLACSRDAVPSCAISASADDSRQALEDQPVVDHRQAGAAGLQRHGGAPVSPNSASVRKTSSMAGFGSGRSAGCDARIGARRPSTRRPIASCSCRWSAESSKSIASHHREAAVDADHLAGDPRRAVAEQERHQRRDVGGLADASQRIHLLDGGDPALVLLVAHLVA